MNGTPNRTGRDILVVDDEQDIRELISGILSDEGYLVRTSGSDEEMQREIGMRTPDLVILDVLLQGSRRDGLELLSWTGRHCPGTPVVVISGHGNIETAIAAIRNRAFDYIEKPFRLDRLLMVVRRALETADMRKELDDLRFRADDRDFLAGESAVIQSLRGWISRIAPTNSRVLLLGPPGSGKEAAARLLHELSGRRDGPFVVAGPHPGPARDVEAALLGVEADRDRPRRPGALERASGGTLFLGDVAGLPPEVQARLAHILGGRPFARLGGNVPVRTDVRVLAGSCCDLEADMQAGLFHRDLYHRLSVACVRLPPLSLRREDIPALVAAFARKECFRQGVAEKPFSPEALRRLRMADFPGNLRELRNCVSQALLAGARSSRPEIGAEMIPETDVRGRLHLDARNEEIMSRPLREAREIFEREYLLAQILRFGGNVSQAAVHVGMERSALHRKLRSLGLDRQGAG